MRKPTFSIAIPAFKRSFLHECIQSVLNQTFPDFELIIVNDHSPQNLDEIVCQFSDPRIVYIKNDTGFGAYNISKNWNKCLNMAHGQFFMCIGDDDKLLPDCLEKYMTLLDDYPGFDIYHAGTQLINEQSEVIDLQESRPVVESAYSMIWHSWFHARKTYIGDFLFKTEALNNMGGFLWTPYAWGSDEQTVYTIAAQGGGIVNMQGYGFQYRVNLQSISGTNLLYKEKAEAWRLGKEWFRHFLLEKPSDPSDILFWQFTRKWFDLYFSDRYKLMIKNDFRNNSLTNYNYWMRNRKQYGLSRKNIWFQLFLGYMQRS